MRNLILAAALLLTPFFMYSQIYGGSRPVKQYGVNDRKDAIEIPLGTPVYLESKNFISSDNTSEGDLAEFKVKADVIVGGRVVISTGATAQGIVRHVTPSNINEPGLLTIVVDQVQAIDGQWVKLSGNEQRLQGRNRAEAAELKPGRSMTAEVSSNKYILIQF